MLRCSASSRRPTPRSARSALVGLVAGVTTVATLTALPTLPASAAPGVPTEPTLRADAGATGAKATPRFAIRRWSSDRAWRRGTTRGLRVRDGRITLARPTGTLAYAGRRYDVARWRSPWARQRFGATSLIPSWNANTPDGTALRVLVRGRTAQGRVGSWDFVATWAGPDQWVRRTSHGTQSDDLASVNVDTVVANGRTRFARWQVELVLMRPRGTRRTPVVSSVGATASYASDVPRRTSRTTMKRTVDLAVPRYSQMIHRNEYPQWDGGGQAWCSPTSMSMVLRHFGSGPTPRQYAWVDDRFPDPWVANGARYSYDYRYDGAGNWPFNTAYAGSFGMDAFVTRFRDLRGVERLVKARIPVIVSLAYGPGELDGAPIGSTNGHLMVIRGFTARGGVIVNDPAAPTNRSVRRVYRRDQLERAWTTASGGVAYVVRPSGRRLPDVPGSV